jgi:hypothetical protein
VAFVYWQWVNIANLYTFVKSNLGIGQQPGNISFGPGQCGPDSSQSEEEMATGGHYQSNGTNYAYPGNSFNRGRHAGPTKECIAQNHHLPVDEFDTRPPTDGCDHGADDCKRCLNSHLLTQLNANIPWNGVTCRRCPHLRLSFDNVLRFANTNPTVREK